MQHLTIAELLESGLVTSEQWAEYTKFAFVRNPFDRAVSAYYWMLTQNGVKNDSFKHFLERSGGFRSVLNDSDAPDNRISHVLPQKPYVFYKDEVAVDFVGRFETFDSDVRSILAKIGVEAPLTLPNIKKSRKPIRHYSHLYSDKIRRTAAKLYGEDCDTFNYSFDCKRSFRGDISLGMRALRRRVKMYCKLGGG